MRNLLRERSGKAGVFMQWQTWAVIGLVIVIAGLAMGWIPNPFAPKGEANVSIGYILANGTEVELTRSSTLYMDPLTFAWYTNSSKTQQITGLWGKLSVTPTTTGLDVTTVSIAWSREVWRLEKEPGSDGSGTKNVPPNQSTTIEESKWTMNLVPGWHPPGSDTWTWTWKYNVTASATDPTVGTKTASTSTQGSISAYWTPDGVLTISAAVTTGYLQITR